jgi:hypothetical protein
MGPVNNPARGLLDLLELKQTGLYPRDFSETIVGTLDLSEFLLSNKVEQIIGNRSIGQAVTIQGTLPMNAPGTILVPGVEHWLVQRYHLNLDTLTVGTSFIPPMVVWLDPIALTNFNRPPGAVYSSTGLVNTAGGATNRFSCDWSSRPFIVPGGSEIVVLQPGSGLTTAAVGGAATYWLALQILRLKI